MLKILPILFFLSSGYLAAQQPLFRNADATAEQRINDLLHTLTLKEKISLLGFNSPGVERMQIPAYNWWNEALHGIARGGEATVFPQAIALAATFNDQLATQVSTAISTEARAKYNLTTSMNRHLQYMGLTFWTPNINIFRDPRWGRGQETYGEDPFLTATMGTAFVRGLQGTDPHYLKTAACAKHFAVHSGPEAERHQFNAIVDEKDLRETYLYAFKKLVDYGVEAVMCAYNRVNNEPCCTGRTLLQDILRNEWHFKGHVVTDCWALEDIWLRHKVIPTSVEVSAAAIKAGVNLDCANILQDDVMAAIEKGLLTEKDVDEALGPNLRTQIKLGFFDPPSLIPFGNYGTDSVHNATHVMLARKVAQQSMVLLKNNGILPLKREKYASIMVAGANASSLDALVGNYHGISGNMVTFVEGISKAAGPAIDVQYDQGCNDTDTTHFGGIWAASGCDLTVVVIGLNPLLEGEDGDAFQSSSGGDKASLSIPKSHLVFLKKLKESTKKPIVAVVTAGSAVDISAIEAYADAVILAWYPGEQGGTALADILFGAVSPSGRLPLTFYQSLQDVPDYKDYSMKGRTYRYFSGKVQYPFGFGLSYTSFSYQWLMQPKNTYTLKDTIKVSFQVENTGNFDGDDVSQAYITYPNLERMPLKELKAFKRVSLLKGNKAEVKFNIPVTELQKWDLAGHHWKLYKGQYMVCIGKNADDFQLKKEMMIK
jgi:beta-glucosidase